MLAVPLDEQSGSPGQFARFDGSGGLIAEFREQLRRRRNALGTEAAERVLSPLRARAVGVVQQGRVSASTFWAPGRGGLRVADSNRQRSRRASIRARLADIADALADQGR